MRPSKAKLAIAALSLGLSFAAVEVALRRSKPLWSVFYPPICFHTDVFESVDFGYRLWPSLERPHRYPPGTQRRILLRANPQGFRDADFTTSDPRPRIVFLGDSMTFGEGVEEEERFTELIEARAPGWRVDNMGMVGYGTDLMLRSFEAVALDPPPRAAVMGVFSDDFRRVVEPYAGVGYPIPRYRLEDGELRTVAYPEPSWWERSRLLQGLRYFWWRYTDATFALNGAILDRFLELCERHGVAPAIVFFPDRQDRWDDRLRRSWLRDYAGERGVPFLDLTDALHAAGAATTNLPGDPHWSAAGHAIVARELYPFLKATVLDAAGPPVRAASTSTDADARAPVRAAGRPRPSPR